VKNRLDIEEDFYDIRFDVPAVSDLVAPLPPEFILASPQTPENTLTHTSSLNFCTFLILQVFQFEFPAE